MAQATWMESCLDTIVYDDHLYIILYYITIE